MAAESREGKRSLSTCDDEEAAAKRNKKQIPKITGNKDVFCWTCHRPGNVATCSECPRAFHLKCGHLDRIPEPNVKWMCPECDTIQRADKQAPSSPAHKSTFSKLLGFVLDRVKRIDGVDNFCAPVDTNKWHDYLEYVIQPMDLPKLKSNIDAHKYRSIEGFLADFRWLVHASYVYNSVHSVYTKIAKSMMNVAKQECEEVKNCAECYMHACTLGDTWFIEPCTTPHVLVWAQLSGFPYWPAKVMRQLSGDFVDVRFFGDHTRANVPASSCFLYSRVMPCSKSKKHSSKITNGIEEAEVYVKNLKSTYSTFCYAQYRVNYLPKEDDCMRKLQLPEFPLANATPEFLAKVETLRKEKMLEDKEFHSEVKRMMSEQEKAKRPSLPQKRKSTDSGSKLLEMKRKLVKIDTPQGQKFAIMNISGSESDSSPKRTPSHVKNPISPLTSDASLPISADGVHPEMNGDHNSNKTPSKVDDETIKQVLARSPKELISMNDKVSPLAPPKDSGIIESLSRKLFTPPEKVQVNGSEKSGQLTRSRRMNIPKQEVSLESDSDSDALVIAEESSPNEISDMGESPEENRPKSQHPEISSPRKTVKLYLKTQSPEGEKQQILIRKSYIASETISLASPIRQKQNELGKAALPMTEAAGTSPLVSKRTRSSTYVSATAGVTKKEQPNEEPLQVAPFGSLNDSSPLGQKKPETMLDNQNPRSLSKGACEPQIDVPSKAQSQPVLSKINSPSTDDNISQPEGVKSRNTLANEKPRRSSRGAGKPPIGPTATDSKPAVECTVNSPTIADVSSRPEEVHTRMEPDRESADKPQTEPSKTDDRVESTINLHSTGDVLSLAKKKGPEMNVITKLSMLSSDESELAVDNPTEADREPRNSLSKSNTMEVTRESLSESKSIVTGSSTLSAETSLSDSALYLSPTKRLPEDTKASCDENSKESESKIIPQDGAKDVVKDPVAVASHLASSNDNFSQKLGRDVQQTTPVKSVICHSTDVSPVQVSSPGSSSVTSSPEGGVLVMNAVRKVPGSMQVPVIKVARAQHPVREEIGWSCNESLKSKDGVTASIVPVEETDKTDTSGTCTSSEAKVVLPNNSGRSTLPISVDKGNVKGGPGERLDSIDNTSSEPAKISDEKAEDTKERPKGISSLDLLDGDLSHMYEDLEPPEEDDESDEPMSSKTMPEGDDTPLKEDSPLPTDSEADESQKESTLSNHGSQQLQNADEVEPTVMEVDVPVEQKVPDRKTPSPQRGPLVENPPSVAVPPMETGAAEESQPIHTPPVTDETVGLDEPTGEPIGVDQPATSSCEAETSPLTSEMSIEPSTTDLTDPVKPEPSSNDTPGKITDPPHTLKKDHGKCTCIMCHVAHPGASFDKTVEDYHLMKSIELVEPKRGLSKETEQFLMRLKETDAFTVSLEACEKDKNVLEASRQVYIDELDESSNKTVRISLVQRPILVSSFGPRKSPDNLDGPSTSFSKPRPLPGLVTLQRRPSSEHKNIQSEKNSGELLIASSMSLNPSHLEQMSKKSPADQSNGTKSTLAKDNTAASTSESQGNDPKKATQNATTMPLPIIIKSDPDADEVPGVPNNLVQPTPPKPTIKVKQMSALLERPPPPSSPKKPEQSTSNRKGCSTPKFNMVPPFEPKKTLADVQKLIESKSQFISAKLKKDIYTLFDQIQHDYDSHMELLEHIADASLNTVESTLETNKNLVFEEMKIRLRNQVDAHVADVKKKQWCILCGNEAAFHCCWGYNYCCEDCQKNDWAEHTKVCTQYNMTATDPYIRASPRFQALLEKQLVGGNNKKIMIQDLIDSPVAVSVQSSPPGKAKPAPAKGRKILAGPRTSFLESDLSADTSNVTRLAIPALAKPSTVATTVVQRLNDQVQTSYKIVQPSRTVRIINPAKARLPQIVSKPQLAPKAVARPVTRSPATSTSGIQRKQIVSGRIAPVQQNTNRSFLRVMDDVEIASILQRNHLSDY